MEVPRLGKGEDHRGLGWPASNKDEPRRCGGCGDWCWRADHTGHHACSNHCAREIKVLQKERSADKRKETTQSRRKEEVKERASKEKGTSKGQGLVSDQEISGNAFLDERDWSLEELGLKGQRVGSDPLNKVRTR